MTKNQMGLVFGYFLAIIHLVWNILVAIIPTQIQAFVDWCANLQGVSISWQIVPVTLVGTIMLVVVTFVLGYVLGWVFGWLVKKVKK